ncbi:hypothetical protein [Nostoc sp.]
MINLRLFSLSIIAGKLLVDLSLHNNHRQSAVADVEIQTAIQNQ